MSDSNPYEYKPLEREADPGTTKVVLAGRWARLGATVLDTLVLAAFGFLGGLALGGFDLAENSAAALAVFGAVAVVLVVQIVLIVTRSQTLGKMVFGIRVWSVEDEERAGWGRYIGLRIIVNGLVSAIPFVGSLYGLIDLLFIFGDDRRCLHDRLAGTIVVKA